MSALGLRLQIVLAASGLMALLTVPLFFAVASLTRAAFFHEREGSARALGRAVAAHVAELHAPDDEALLRALESHVGGGGEGDSMSPHGGGGEGDSMSPHGGEGGGEGGVECVCVFRPQGRVCAGDPMEVAT